MPDHSALLDAAFARHQAGDLAEAIRLYREILAADPLHPDALHMMGVIARQKGNDALALKLIETALGQRTAMPLAWHNRSLILRLMGRKDEARQSSEQAVSLDPTFAEAWDMLGMLLRDQRDFDAALAAQTRAVTLRPDDMKFLSNYALLLLATGKLADGYRVMQSVEKRDPNLLPQTMGNILKAAGYTDRALPYYRRSCALLPQNDELRVSLAMALLQVGDFTEGWKIWEQRPDLDARFKNVPFWRGELVEHLLVHEDQGLGDAFQCARYIPELKQYAKRITIQVTRVLHRLFTASFPDDEVLTLDDPAPAADGRIRMLSLPAFFGYMGDTTLPLAGGAGGGRGVCPPSEIPTFQTQQHISYSETSHLTSPPCPPLSPPASGRGTLTATNYLTVQSDWRTPWRERLAHRPQPRIGIVWGGNPDHLNDRMRSVPFPQIAPILQAGGAHIVSLQKGAQKNGADLAATGSFDADPLLGDFADTAGLMAELDLLISVDTSVVHLAGALGKPVWLLLPFDPDWRWLLGREDSPWYPNLRIFRQRQPRNWPHVIERVTADLRKFLADDRSVLQPTRWNGPCLRENPDAISLEPRSSSL